MTDADIILIRILAGQDAPRLPLRDWSGHAASNRYQWLKRGGVPFRAQASSDAKRKSGERLLTELAADGLLNVAKGTRVKFPLVSLTPAGEARAQALVGLGWWANGFLFLARVYEATAEHGFNWVPETALNDGKGWGESTAEDRRGLGKVELEYLPAAARGWVRAGSTIHGHAGYQVTEAGWTELEVLTDTPDFGPQPEYDPAADELYSREQAAYLEAMRTEAPADFSEIGELPLSVGAAFAPNRENALRVRAIRPGSQNAR